MSRGGSCAEAGPDAGSSTTRRNAASTRRALTRRALTRGAGSAGQGGCPLTVRRLLYSFNCGGGEDVRVRLQLGRGMIVRLWNDVQT